MNIEWEPAAWDDYQYWLKTDKKILRRINELIKDIVRSPFDGIGKPEPLKYHLSAHWSRRITGKHRIIYKVIADRVRIIQCRYHY